MEKKECMGCQTSFQEGQKLIMENLTTEYKHYQIPLKDNKHKWTILKTITSFLNCKGGTIYIGVEDKEGAIHGIFLERKERDNFSLFMKHLIEKIHPKVDLSSKEEVIIH
jgi:predicted HTH transcriptional regulator